MILKPFPVIDLEATGQNIRRLRQARGLSVGDIQAYLGFSGPQAIYKWQRGLTLPSVDNLVALSVLLEVPMDAIIITENQNSITSEEPREASRGSVLSFDGITDRCA